MANEWIEVAGGAMDLRLLLRNLHGSVQSAREQILHSVDAVLSRRHQLSACGEIPTADRNGGWRLNFCLAKNWPCRGWSKPRSADADVAQHFAQRLFMHFREKEDVPLIFKS
jgi:hypothetical protein